MLAPAVLRTLSISRVRWRAKQRSAASHNLLHSTETESMKKKKIEFFVVSRFSFRSVRQNELTRIAVVKKPQILILKNDPAGLKLKLK